MSETRNVYQRFSDACNIIGSQQWVKNMENKQYSSVPIDDMRAGVRKACIQAGLVHVGPCEIDSNREVIDGRTFRYFGSCKFYYVNIDEPEERIEFESIGEAMDNGDKGTAKFVTNLIKNHYKAAFDIGELGKDDIDSYSNEELYAEADRIYNKREADAEQRSKFSAANMCKKVIGDWMSEDPLGNSSNEVIADYAGRFGTMDQWKPGTWIQCYKELKDSGVKLREVAL